MANSISIRRDAAVTELRLDRSAKANALSSEVVEALLAAVEAATREGVRLLVLRGEGSNFCAGFDFTDVQNSSDGDLLHRFVRMEQLLQALYHAPFATLALCHGGTYGAGADLACACDRRIAAPNTVFRMPGLRFGIALGTRRLAQRVGSDIARDILGSSRIFDAAEAERIGFTNATAAPDAWDNIVRETAASLRLDASAYAALKQLTQPDTRAADLAAIAATASVPGLKDRILSFRASKG